MSAPEQFANLAETTLSAAYVAGSGVLSVTSTSGFPTVGPFRVRLDNSAKTLFRVDWVYGSNFYGVAEANDGAASSSNAVVLVWTRGSAERVIQAPETGFLGDPMTGYAGVSGAQGYGPTWKLGFDQTAWSWVNQGTSNVRQGGGVLEIVAQSAAGTSVRLRTLAIPSRPFAITIGVVPFFPLATNLANLSAIGIAFYESSSTKFNFFNVANFNFANGNAANGTIAFQQYATPTGGTGTLYAQKLGGTDFSNMGMARFLPPFGIVWLRLSDDGVNVKAEYSWDKINWNLMVAPQSRTTGFTTAPDNIAIGFTLQSGSVSPSLIGYIVSYELTQPGYGTVPTGAAVLTGYQPGITIT